MSAASASHFAKHTHDQFGIGVIDEGCHASLSDAGDVTAGPGDLILVNPGEVHDGRPAHGAGRRWRMLYFDPSFVEELHDDLLQGSRTQFALHAPIVRDPTLRVCFNAAFARSTDDSPSRGISQESAHLEMFARLLVGLGRREQPSGHASPIAIRRARELIDDDPSQPLTLSDLAHLSGISRFQLHRGFQRVHGLAPHDYILQKRIALARRLLKEGLSPADVAAAAGFCDQSHLNRIFVRTMGSTPGKYR